MRINHVVKNSTNHKTSPREPPNLKTKKVTKVENQKMISRVNQEIEFLWIVDISIIHFNITHQFRMLKVINE